MLILSSGKSNDAYMKNESQQKEYSSLEINELSGHTFMKWLKDGFAVAAMGEPTIIWIRKLRRIRYSFRIWAREYKILLQNK